MAYEKQLTALLVIDPYSDFISEGGKVWDRLKGVAGANRCIPHMLQVLNAARKADIRVFYALHRRRPAQGKSPVPSESRHAVITALCPAMSLATAAVPTPGPSVLLRFGTAIRSR